MRQKWESKRHTKLWREKGNKEPLETQTRRWENNNKINHKKIRLHGADRIKVAQDSDKWCSACIQNAGFDVTKCGVFIAYLSNYCFLPICPTAVSCLSVQLMFLAYLANYCSLK
jgi:hypothetical protein